MARKSYKTWTEGEEEFLKNNGASYTPQDLADKFSTTEASVRGKANRLKIELKSPSRRKYNLDDKVFKKNDPETSYWIGFLWADGNVQKHDGSYRTSIELQYSDKDHLKKFRDFLNAEYPLYRTHDGNAAKIGVTSQEIFEDLNRYGIVPAKTYKNKKPKIRNRFIPHFMRGLFDGDGYFYEGNSEGYGMRIEIVNTKFTCGWLETMTKKAIDINSNTYSNKGKEAFSWVSGGKNQVKKITNWMYKKKVPRLNRKYNKLKKFSLVGGGQNS